MTDETVECFNCGSANPEWAQVCRSCGVALRHGEARVAPAGRFPTDQESLISMGAVIGTILAALLIGLFVSSLNPTDPTVGLESPSPSATPEPSLVASGPPVATDTPAPAASATPVPLPATIVFGTELDANRQVVTPVDTFTPGMTFVHSISSTEPFGVETLGEQVVRINEDGSEGDEVVAAAGNQLRVDPAATSGGFVGLDAEAYIGSWGPGLYELRVYGGETLLARGQFRLAEG